MRQWACPTVTKPRAGGLSGMHCCPSGPTNPMRLWRCGRERGSLVPMHPGRPSRRSIPTPTIRRAPRGRRDRTGPRIIPTAEPDIMFGWLIPIGGRPIRDDAFLERSRLASLVSDYWPLRGGCGAHCSDVSRTERLPIRPEKHHGPACRAHHFNLFVDGPCRWLRARERLRCAEVRPRGLDESLHAEVEPFGITTTVVNPGFFRTELLTEQSTSPRNSPTPNGYPYAAICSNNTASL